MVDIRSRIDVDDALFGVLRTIVLTLLIAFALLPFLYTLLFTFRSESRLFEGPYWLPEGLSFAGWTEATVTLLPGLWNSFVVASGTTLLALCISVPSAYVFARREFPGRTVLFYAVLVALLFPFVMLVIPIMDIWYFVGLYDTIVGLWVAHQTFVAPFALWVLRDAFRKLPSGIEEAAQVYGHTQFSAFVRVVLPQAAPSVFAVSFLVFLLSWNDFLFSNMLTTTGGPETAVVQLFGTLSGNLVELFIVGTPPTVLFVLAYRRVASAIDLA
jgi:ABC-type glycerol-3-phosphate transport system permease component